MARLVIGGLVVAIIAALLFFIYSGSYRTRNQEQGQQISELSNQVNKLQAENEQLKNDLAKVQSEGSRLAAQNEEMRKAIGSFKATGKIPEVPPPAK
jgi:peptidoglycan hydrolase CwlO-like protein